MSLTPKTLCQIAACAVSLPAGLALRSTMKAVARNKANNAAPSSDQYRSPLYGAIFGAVLGMSIQAVTLLGVQIARTEVQSKIEQNGLYGRTTISHVLTSDRPPKDAVEAFLNFTTARGFYEMARSSYNSPNTVVQFYTSNNDNSVFLAESYPGFLDAKDLKFTNPRVIAINEHPKQKELARIIEVANYSLSK